MMDVYVIVLFFVLLVLLAEPQSLKEGLLCVIEIEREYL